MTAIVGLAATANSSLSTPASLTVSLRAAWKAESLIDEYHVIQTWDVSDTNVIQ